MQSRGARNPGLNAIACLIAAVAAAIAIWTGVGDMIALGRETGSTALRIGLGLFVLILSTVFCLNFLWGHHIVTRLRSGQTKFAGWTVPPSDYARFREVDAAFAGRGTENDYRPLAAPPPQGVEVAFSRDGVLIGDRYFGLASTGLNRFDAVSMIGSDPPMLEFGMITTTATGGAAVRFRRIRSILRVPVASDAALRAEKVLFHFQAVLRGQVIVHPDFWKLRIRIGLIGAAISATCAAVGFLLRDANDTLHNVPLGLAVVGTILAIGGLLLAFLAWSFDRSRRPASSRPR